MTNQNFDIGEDFTNRLIQLRLEKGASAREMSLALGQNGNYINAIENRKNFPSMTLFFYICEYLGVTPMEFFYFENKEPLMTSELISISKSLDKKLLEHITAIIYALAKNDNKR
ncbi:hypothetical protein IMSAG049_01665 [Clostridiales bacterium]|nr:hypothetical protein IMSAG049_01665 [Clostridiales bacterium]